MAKPTRKPTFATNNNPADNEEPDTALQIGGVPLGSVPGRQHYNYLWGSTSEWVDWLEAYCPDLSLNLSDLPDKSVSRANLGANNAANLTTGLIPSARLPSSAITLNGDVSGSGTMTNLGSVTITTSIPSATTTNEGLVQLNDTTSSTSTTEAATANSVRAAYSLANNKISATTANVLAATAAASVGAVGTYAFLQRVIDTDTPTNPGGTAAGASLRYANRGFADSGAAFGYINTSPSGSWRCMGADYYSSGSGTDNDKYTGTLWLRII